MFSHLIPDQRASDFPITIYNRLPVVIFLRPGTGWGWEYRGQPELLQREFLDTTEYFWYVTWLFRNSRTTRSMRLTDYGCNPEGGVVKGNRNDLQCLLDNTYSTRKMRLWRIQGYDVRRRYRSTVVQQVLALAMGLHPRLGQDCLLSEDIVRLIADMHFVCSPVYN